MYVEDKSIGEPQVLTEDQIVLLRAAELLENKGWIQHQASNDYGYCALGALDAALNRSGPYQYTSFLRLEDKLSKQIFGKSTSVPIGAEISEWNDAKGRTAAEVIAVFRGAAK
jgi:hypothetical protein